VYLFRSASGYLYVGEAANLAARLQVHIEGSDQTSLAEYLANDDAEAISVELHIFPADSPASRVAVRRAYESELIRSRQPKFNIRP
jgi:excinuclease UvrABC nuclease subunit